MIPNEINWELVNKRLRCPVCHDEAHISSGTDGTEGEHTHRFPVSRELARLLSLPDKKEIETQIRNLEIELERLRGIKDKLN